MADENQTPKEEKAIDTTSVENKVEQETAQEENKKPVLASTKINRGAILRNLSKDNLNKENLDDYKVGDTVKVTVKISEGKNSRSQVFSGIVLAKKSSGISETVTVRKVAYGGYGVERVFSIHSPLVESIKVERRGKVRRSKLYYLRNTVGKSFKVKENLG